MLATIPMCCFIIRDSNSECSKWNCSTFILYFSFLLDYKAVKSPLKSYLKILSISKVVINGFVIIVVAQLLSFLDPTMEPHLRQIGLAPSYVSLVFLLQSATYTLR